MIAESLGRVAGFVVDVFAFLVVCASVAGALIVMLFMARAVMNSLDRFRAHRQRRAIRLNMKREMAKVLDGMLAEALRRGDESMSGAVRQAAEEIGVDLSAVGAEPSPEGGYRVKREDA